MFRRKPGAFEKRAPRKPEYANVVPLHQTRYETGGEFNAERHERLKSKLEKSVRRVVDRFLESNDVEDLAKMNDVMLRFMLKVPARIRESREDRRTLFSKIRKTAGQVMMEKRRKATEEIKRAGADSEMRSYAEGRLRILEDASVALDERLRKLESSVLQLARFVAHESKQNPERVFATGVNLDVAYGIDLIGIDLDYRDADQEMVMNLTFYQAKASQVGLRPEQVRDLPQRYEEKEHRVWEDLEFDQAWAQKEIIERRTIPTPTMGAEEAFDILTGSEKQLAQTFQNLDELHPADRYRAELAIYQQIKLMADEFEEAVPATVKIPNIQLGSVEGRYLVDTAEGTQDLSTAEAKNYKQAS